MVTAVAGTDVSGRTHQQIVSHQGQYGSKMTTLGTSMPWAKVHTLDIEPILYSSHETSLSSAGVVSVDNNSTSVTKAEIEREIEKRARIEGPPVEAIRPYRHRHPRILCWVMTQPKNHAARRETQKCF